MGNQNSGLSDISRSLRRNLHNWIISGTSLRHIPKFTDHKTGARYHVQTFDLKIPKRILKSELESKIIQAMINNHLPEKILDWIDTLNTEFTDCYVIMNRIRVAYIHNAKDDHLFEIGLAVSQETVSYMLESRSSSESSSKVSSSSTRSSVSEPFDRPMPKPQKADSDQQVDLVCKVCMDKIINVVLIPCGHATACSNCVRQIPNRQCPICRQVIQKQQSLFIG